MSRRNRYPSLLLLAIIGLVMYLGVNLLSALLNPSPSSLQTESGFPRISKQQAAEAAAGFARSKLALTENYESDVRLQSYKTRSGYLQREQLAEQYEERYGEKYPIDYFEVEMNDRTTGTTYYVAVNFLNGGIIGWDVYPSAAAGDTGTGSSASDAVKLAESRMYEMGYRPGDYQLIQNGQPYLLFEHKTERIGDSKPLLRIAVAGEQVRSFHPEFSIPESYLSWQQAQDERSAQMTRISMGISFIMTMGALFVMIKYRREITFSRGLIMTLVFLAVYVSHNFNMIPGYRTYHGGGPSEQGIEFYLWFINIFTGLLALSTYFTLSAGRQLWAGTGDSRYLWPTWRSDSFGRHVKKAMVNGYLLCLFILGVQQVLFFAAAEGFDVWAVNDPADSVYNMAYPAIFPLLAWAAAISEEAAYRLFGIAFFQRLVKSRFLAILLPSVIWAMSHTQYPIYPVYTRLVEVAVIGVIFGYAFLRYGFLTAVFAHAAMDSILMGLSVMYLGGATHVLTGAFYLVFPALAGWLLAWLHGKRRPAAGSYAV